MKNKEFQLSRAPNSVPTTEDGWKELITKQCLMGNRGLDRKFTPNNGILTEVLEFIRELRKRDEISYEEALRLSDQAIRDTGITQMFGFPVESDSIEQIKDLKLFPGALNEDGTVNFSEKNK